MDRALYTSMTGAKHNTLAQTVHANNLANVSTDGFRRDYVEARSMGIWYGDGLPTRAHALTERPATDFAIGSLRETGRDLDVAVRGQGWIAVQAPDGSEAYTRAGNLQITPFGQLLTGNGLPVLGNGGPIAIPDSAKVEIGGDGTITVRGLGQGPEALADIDRIRLVNPPRGAAGEARGRPGLPARRRRRAGGCARRRGFGLPRGQQRQRRRGTHRDAHAGAPVRGAGETDEDRRREQRSSGTLVANLLMTH